MEQFDTFKMINDLTKGFEKLVKQANDSLNNLPEEQRQNVAKHQSELNNVIKELKKGNIEGLKKIIKNANSDSK